MLSLDEVVMRLMVFPFYVCWIWYILHQVYVRSSTLFSYCLNQSRSVYECVYPHTSLGAIRKDIVSSRIVNSFWKVWAWISLSVNQRWSLFCSMIEHGGARICQICRLYLFIEPASKWANNVATSASILIRVFSWNVILPEGRFWSSRYFFLL